MSVKETKARLYKKRITLKMALNDNPIPKSVPLHPKSGKYFHNLHARDLSNIYQQCYKQIDETINQLVDSTSPSTIGIEEQVADITSTYKLLSTYESESNSFDEHIKDLKKISNNPQMPVRKSTFLPGINIVPENSPLPNYLNYI